MLTVTAHDLEIFFRNPLFSICSQEERAVLQSRMKVLEYRSGDVIVREGGDLPFLGVLSAGMVLAERRHGRVGPRNLLLPMDMVGRPDRTHSSYDLRVVSDSRVCSLAPEDVKSHMGRNQGSVVLFLSKTLGLVGSAREWIWIAYHTEAFERVCLFLCCMIHTYKRAGLFPNAPPWKIQLSLTRAEIGAFLGLGLFTVSRHLSSLKENGIISFFAGRSITILDPVSLYRLARVNEEALTSPDFRNQSFNDLLEF